MTSCRNHGRPPCGAVRCLCCDPLKVKPGRGERKHGSPPYLGKCAELCGEYHSLMLFTVKVVSETEYEDYIEAQRSAGYEGQLGLDYNVNQNLPGNGSSDEE